MAYNAAVIGLGNIGLYYDLKGSVKNTVLTHAKALDRHPGMQLVGAVDANLRPRRAFESNYDAPAYETVSELFANQAIDVAIVSVPTEHHLSTMTEVLRGNPRIVLCEKPFGQNLGEAQEIETLANRKNSLVAVNYFRRFDPEMAWLKKGFSTGEFGGLSKGVVWYSNGLKNNASHFVDLLHFLIGPTEVLRVFDRKSQDADFLLQCDGAEVYFIGCDENHYSVGEMHLTTERGQLYFKNSGHQVDIRMANASPLFPNHRKLGETYTIETQFLRYQYHVVDGLFQALSNQSPLPSTSQTAVRTAKTVEKVIQLSRGDQHESVSPVRGREDDSKTLPSV